MRASTTLVALALTVTALAPVRAQDPADLPVNDEPSSFVGTWWVSSANVAGRPIPIETYGMRVEIQPATGDAYVGVLVDGGFSDCLAPGDVVWHMTAEPASSAAEFQGSSVAPDCAEHPTAWRWDPIDGVLEWSARTDNGGAQVVQAELYAEDRSVDPDVVLGAWEVTRAFGAAPYAVGTRLDVTGAGPTYEVAVTDVGEGSCRPAGDRVEIVATGDDNNGGLGYRADAFPACNADPSDQNFKVSAAGTLSLPSMTALRVGASPPVPASPRPDQDDPDIVLGTWRAIDGAGDDYFGLTVEVTATGAGYAGTVTAVPPASCHDVGATIWTLTEDGADRYATEVTSCSGTTDEDDAFLSRAEDTEGRRDLLRLSGTYERVGPSVWTPDAAPPVDPPDDPPPGGDVPVLCTGPARQGCPIGGDLDSVPARTFDPTFDEQITSVYTSDQGDVITMFEDVGGDGVFLARLSRLRTSQACVEVGDVLFQVENLTVEQAASGLYQVCKGLASAQVTAEETDGVLVGVTVCPDDAPNCIVFRRTARLEEINPRSPAEVSRAIVEVTSGRLFPPTERGLEERVLFVATDAAFPDNLAVAGVTGQAGALALQISPTDRAANLAAIESLRPDRLVVVGGQVALPDEVLPDPADLPWDRLGGLNRFDTARVLSSSFYPNGSRVVMIATGANFPDAVAGGAWASLTRSPVLLVDGERMPEETMGELSRLAPDRIVIFGGTAVVPTSIEEQLRGMANVVERLAGPNRSATAAEVSRRAYPNGSSIAYVANGEDFRNALSVAANAWVFGGPLLLTSPTSLPAETRDELARLGADHVLAATDEFEFDPRVHAELADALPAAAPGAG